ncbi:ABC transporter ATP-binding protein [candidate division KSB1 bacterium]|nr:ABC transporter ATP-binding protein [candidate division KSB1 bacterium]
MEIIVNAVNIHKNFMLGKREIPVLKGIDLKIHRGELLVIVGPSGVGKSTLLHILGALDRPSSGQVYISDTLIFEKSDKELANLRNRTVGFVFQFHHLLPEFTALENVAMPGFIAGHSRKSCLKKAESLLAEFNLQDRIDHKPSELSGGEQQRVAVARALMNDPHIILADEPSGNLDVKSGELLHDLLLKLSTEKNQTIVVATHNLELKKRAQRVVEMYDGTIHSDYRVN